MFARLAPKAFIVTGVILNVVLGIGTAIFTLWKNTIRPQLCFLSLHCLVPGAIGRPATESH